MPTPGPLELVIILVIALLILGPGKLPDVGAALGKSIKEFRKASTDVQEAVTVNVDTSPLPANPAPAPAAPVAAAVAAPVAVAATAPTPYTNPYHEPTGEATPDAEAASAEPTQAPAPSVDSTTVAS